MLLVGWVWGCEAPPLQSIEQSEHALAGICSVQKGKQHSPSLCSSAGHAHTRWPVVIVHGLSGNPFNGQTAQEWEAEPRPLQELDAYLRAAMQLSSGCRPCDTMLREAARDDSAWSESRLEQDVFAPVHTACHSSPQGHAMGFCCGSPSVPEGGVVEQRFYVAHLPPYRPSEARAQCLLAQLKVFQSMYEAPRVHAIGHSQGGADVFVAARGDHPENMRQVFATVTAVQTPFLGTPVAELFRQYLRELIARGVDVGQWLQSILDGLAESLEPLTSRPSRLGAVAAASMWSQMDYEASMKAAIEMVATWIKAQGSDNVTGVDLWNMLEQHAGYADVYPLNPNVQYQTFAGVGIPSVVQFIWMHRQALSSPGAFDWTNVQRDDGIWAYAQAYLREYLPRADDACHGLYLYPIAPGVDRLSDLSADQWWRLRRVRPELGLEWQLATGAVISAENIVPNDGMAAVSSAALGEPWAMPMGMLRASEEWPQGEVKFRGCLPAEHGDPFGVRSMFDRIGFQGPDHTHECTGFSHLCFLRTLLGELAAIE